MPTQPKHFVSPEEYLELERKAEYKSEYYNGEIFAMSGASINHNAIAGQLYFLIARHLQSRTCRWFPSDMRLLVPNGLYTYPDLSVVCGDPQPADTHLDTLT